MILYLCGDDRALSGVFDGPVYTTHHPVEERHLKADWIVSYGYRHILSPEICKRFDGRAVNLHIGLLPWNRGAHQNVWSAIDGTPSGVSLHYMDAGIDTGDLIAQREIWFNGLETLAESHDVLKQSAEALFFEWWPRLLDGNAPRIKQQHKGTFHLAKDLPPISWDTQRRQLTRSA